MKKTKKKAKKKRNYKANDSTLINVEADHKRDDSLKKRVERLEEWCEALTHDLMAMYEEIAGSLAFDTHSDSFIKPRRGK